ncbi:hypothetical protein [Nocardioides flavescens]|uniref:FtsX-like permease family protein n=1 Tax=Nocardioides flavescens TaxID=2691959 RepID=A0A6L7F202_9ACTN|nr:hypothetical protein [Nocardioides flavescens]MXG91585.1 hypothetical protein [Nocardioides flavescens]
MRPLWVAVVAGAGQLRGILVLLTTALVSGLLLVAVSYARLGGWGGYQSTYDGGAPLFGPVADPGTRGGAILGVVLLCLPVVLLLDQCVRLGSAAQRRRYEALAVAGASRRDLRRWGAIETGVPAVAGAALGVGVWIVMRQVLGYGLATSPVRALVPTATGPGWWTLLVIVLVAAYGVLVGQRAAARASRPPRAPKKPPRPWGLLVLGAAVALLAPWMNTESELPGLAAVALVTVGLALTTPWLAHVMASRLHGRTDDPAELLATARIRADHGAAGRAAAAVGAVGATSGVAGALLVRALTEQYVDLYIVVPLLLVGSLAALVLGVITSSLALHSIEATLTRGREVAALVATGVPLSTLERAVEAECRIVTMPVTTGAALCGALAITALTASPSALVGGLVGAAVVAIGLRFAVRCTARLTAPWLHRAVAQGSLRTA